MTALYYIEVTLAGLGAERVAPLRYRRGEDPFGYRAELVDLVRLARALDFAE